MEEGRSGKGGGGCGGLGLVRDRARGRMLYVGAPAIEAYAALVQAVPHVVLVAFDLATAPLAAGKRRLRSRRSRWGLSFAVATSQPAARQALLNTTEPLWTLSTRMVSGTEPLSWAEMYKRTPRREVWSASGRCRSCNRPSPLFSPPTCPKSAPAQFTSSSSFFSFTFSSSSSSAAAALPPRPRDCAPLRVLRLVVFLVAPRPRPYLVLRRRSPA